MTLAIEIRNMQKYFGDFPALKDVSMTVTPGQVVGFIGPNGAGKTTTMRILATLEIPTSGDAFVHGINCVEFPEKVRNLIGYMPDSYGSYPATTVYDYLDFFMRCQYLSPVQRLARLKRIMDYTELCQVPDKPVDSLSKGMKQRLSLARALVNDPQLLILDEPAAGLDPRARIELRELLKLLARERGKTILISSHILSELAEICDSVVFIDGGTITRQGQIDHLTSIQHHEDEPGIFIELKTLDSPDNTRKFLLEQPFITRVDLTADGYRIFFTGDKNEQAELVRRIVQCPLALTEFKVSTRNLEDVFLELTKGDLR